ncbi:multidrug ABC transporter permease [Actinoplanes sp. SE50]|uniref:ABC transporter transmembrane domain-containing protein n=1 Tax=unclassified Actinoplanes TaxID=2626549 RepID=UPI00023EBC92|nr:MULTISPECIES: ABC transporter ATP-binding protein [unclassified Actinoplanes]AEV81749.1 Lipid A export ATP-binding/permease protein msbA [Actinoplanes sp. SE50/110]ATO80150.1 multidrug ABC transporter permease [Actinoplanes sp. SE50]SLL97554.1 multidrug ABC transporter permease [Actinoplanes sp. SE50/110]
MRRLPVADPGLPDARSATRYLSWLIRRSRMTMLTAIALAIAWMGCQSLVPAIVGEAIDAAAERRGRALLGWGLVLFAAGVAQAVAGISRHRFSVVNWLGAGFRTVQVTVRQANRLGSSLPRRLEAGEVVAIGTSDINHIGGAVDVAARGAGALVAVGTVTVLLLRTSVPLGLVVLIGVPALMIVVGGLIGPLHARQQTYRERQGRLTGQAADLVTGLRVLRGVGGEAVMVARYRQRSQALRVAGVRTAEVESLLEAAQVLLPGTLLVLITWLGARFAAEHRISIGQLVSFYAYAAFLVSPLRQLTDSIDKLTRGHVSARRVADMLGLRRDLPDPPAKPPVTVPPPGGELADPLSGVLVMPGRLTAIVAEDPADTARIADRLGRYAPGATWDGTPLTAIPLEVVRERILVVENEARLFSGRLRADLDPHRTPRLAEALAAASAQDIVDGLPGGLDSVVAERGRSFSGGQQQRLRLARALVADPEFLILVEPTNAVDAHTEARIAERLRAVRAGRTTVVCTSSPLVLAHTDRVFFVECGRVTAAGAHPELLAAEPGYARVVLREELS